MNRWEMSVGMERLNSWEWMQGCALRAVSAGNGEGRRPGAANFLFLFLFLKIFVLKQQREE